MHGGAPRVRREKNNDTDKAKVTINTEKAANIAIEAAITGITAGLISSMLNNGNRTRLR